MSAVSFQDSASGADNRPLLIGASCVALATLVPVALYQLGVISGLPDPPLRIFDSKRITLSKTAHPFGMPDALLGIASFGTSLALALLAERSKTAKRLLGVKLGLDVSAAAFNTARQVIEFGKVCSWCTATALSAGVMAYAGRASFSQVVSEGCSLAKGLLPEKDYAEAKR